MTEVDKYNRSALDLAELHEYDNIVEILKKHLNITEKHEEHYVDLSSWHDFYPGIKIDKR